ncbi:MAG: PepSY-associated TM helix domain-containing protein [Planctomycetaceae bacterium]
MNTHSTTSTIPSTGKRLPGSRSEWWRAFWGAIRWLHIYLSLFGFATILFSSITGLTLNHPTWFGGVRQTTERFEGSVELVWTGREDEAPDWLRLAEHLRATHRIQGQVRELRDDGVELSLEFAGPAYAADVLVRRDDGRYSGIITRHGAVALINDLHKGRDTGFAWSMVIDLSSLLMGLSAMTGLMLLYSLKRKRLLGTVVAVAGTLALWIAYQWMVL